jgi:polyisoprenoid-binding protein YceI
VGQTQPVERRRRVLILVLVSVAVLVTGGIALVLLSGGDGPEPLTFDDATTTAPDGGSAPAPTGSPAAPPVGDLDGAWVVGAGSQAGYRVLEDRLGGAANIEAVGRTGEVTGGFTVEGERVSGITATVDVASITSDSGFRDSRFRGDIMDAVTHPTATFTADPVTVTALPQPGGTVDVPVSGTLTLRGVSQPVQVTLQVRREGDQLQVLGAVPVVFADHGIETPSPPGLSVRDNGTVEFLLVAARA